MDPIDCSEHIYENLLGPNSTTAERRHLYARYLAAETEFWRSHQQAAAVMHFTALGYSRPLGQTSDHWLDVAKLRWEPQFFKSARDSFAPVGVIIEDWADQHEAGKAHDFSVILINDLGADWNGRVALRLLREGRSVQQQNLEAFVAGLGRTALHFNVTMPAACGSYQVEATLKATPEGSVSSLRDFRVVTARGNSSLRSATFQPNIHLGEPSSTKP